MHLAFVPASILDLRISYTPNASFHQYNQYGHCTNLSVLPALQQPLRHFVLLNYVYVRSPTGQGVSVDRVK